MKPAPTRRLWWLMATFTACVLGYLRLHPEGFRLIGLGHYGVWSLDLFAILASNDALARGLDVYVPNPLDYFHRPHVYSHWWLILGRIGLTRADAAWLGAALGAAFFAAALVRLRPREPRELLLTLAVVCSPPVLLAWNRANNDIVIFLLLAPVVPCLLGQRAALRYCALALLAVATALKTYPAVGAVVLVAGGTWREMRSLLLVAAVVFAALAVDWLGDFPRYGGLIPQPEGLLTFGAVNVFNAWGMDGAVARLGGVVAAVVVIGICWRKNVLAGWQIEFERRASWLSFVLGAVLLTGCFLAGASYGYRWIFALWLVPLLWDLRRDIAAPDSARRLASVTGMLLMVALWTAPLTSAGLTQLGSALPSALVERLADAVFLLEQPFTWALFVCLLVFLTHFARECVRSTASASTPLQRRG